jgi:hypothetical protein
MKRRIVEGFAVVALLALACAGAATAQKVDDKRVHELFVKSGLEQLMQEIPAIFQSGMDPAFEQDQNLRKLPRSALQGIREAAAEAYSPQKTTGVMMKSIGGKMSAADIASVLKWLDSPIGRKCTNLEKDSATAEGVSQMSQFAQKIQKTPPPPERLKLIAELDRVTNATATAVEMFMNTNLAVATAVTLSLPQDTRRPIAQIKKELEDNRAAIEKALQAQTQVGMLYTYRTLTDKEIRRYIDFSDSPAGKKFNSVSIEAFQHAMIQCGIDFGKAVARIFEQLGTQSEI